MHLMARRSVTIVSGAMNLWLEGHEDLPEAFQHDLARDTAISLFQGRSTVSVGASVMEINGVALGQGASGEVANARLHADRHGYPIAMVKCVITPARVPGLRCSFGYLNNSRKYSRKWVAILGDEQYWQWSLGLPPIME